MTYAEILRTLWLAARAPRVLRAPTSISLFAGGGGSSLGYKMAGYKVLAAVEWMPYPAACYRLNFPETPLLEGDITKIDPVKLMADLGLKEGELDVLDGSPPCQGFSTSGKRELTDPRNSLFQDYVRFLVAFKPRSFVMENVTGLVKGKMLWVFQNIMKELESSGYQVACAVLNAKYFNVPQSRARTIFIGLRNDLGKEPSHPSAQTQPISVSEALPHLRALCYCTGPRKNYTEYNKVFKSVDSVNTITKNPSRLGEGLVASSGKISSMCLLPIELDVPAPLMTGKTALIAAQLLSGQRGSDLPENQGSWFSLQRLNPKQPAPTITKMGAFGNQALVVHPSLLRGLSIGEVRRLGGFPDDYQFVKTAKPLKDWVNAWAVVGNSVPPPFMRAISMHVRGLLET